MAGKRKVPKYLDSIMEEIRERVEKLGYTRIDVELSRSQARYLVTLYDEANRAD